MIIKQSRTGHEASSKNVLRNDGLQHEPMWSNEILVADDDEAVRKSLVRLLTCHGYSTLAAENGMEALQLAVQHRPPILLMDIEMPIMNGLDAARAIKSQGALNGVQVIALSASLIPQDPSATVFTQILQKPCPAAAVIAAIEAAIVQHCLRKVST